MDFLSKKKDTAAVLKRYLSDESMGSYESLVATWESQNLVLVPGYQGVLVLRGLEQAACRLLTELNLNASRNSPEESIRMKLDARSAADMDPRVEGGTQYLSVLVEGYSSSFARSADRFGCPIEEYGFSIRISHLTDISKYQSLISNQKKLEESTGYCLVKKFDDSRSVTFVAGGLSGLLIAARTADATKIDSGVLRLPLARVLAPYYNEAPKGAKAYFGDFFFSLFPEYAPRSMTLDQLESLREKGVSFWRDVDVAIYRATHSSSSKVKTERR